jgi:hypothetical protein
MLRAYWVYVLIATTLIVAASIAALRSQQKQKGRPAAERFTDLRSQPPPAPLSSAVRWSSHKRRMHQGGHEGPVGLGGGGPTVPCKALKPGHPGQVIPGKTYLYHDACLYPRLHSTNSTNNRAVYRLEESPIYTVLEDDDALVWESPGMHSAAPNVYVGMDEDSGGVHRQELCRVRDPKHPDRVYLGHRDAAGKWCHYTKTRNMQVDMEASDRHEVLRDYGALRARGTVFPHRHWVPMGPPTTDVPHAWQCFQACEAKPACVQATYEADSKTCQLHASEPKRNMYTWIKQETVLQPQPQPQPLHPASTG